MRQKQRTLTNFYTSAPKERGVYCFTLVCVSVRKQIFVKVSSTTTHRRCLKFCFPFDMPYGEIHFCTNTKPTSCLSMRLSVECITNFVTVCYTILIADAENLTLYSWPVRIRIRIGPPHPLMYRKRGLNVAVLLMRPDKPMPRVTAGVALPAQRP
jgi:hypothetical protein